MKITTVLMALLVVAAVIANGRVAADKTQRLARRVNIDNQDDDDPAVGRRRFSRFRGRRPSRRRVADDDDADDDEAQFAPRPRGGAAVRPIDVAPSAPTAEAGTRRGGARSGRRLAAGRRGSRQRGGDTTESPTSSALLLTPSPPQRQQLSTRDRTSSPSAPSTDRQSGRGRAGSRFNLEAYLKETNQFPVADIGTEGLPGHSATAPESVSAPSSSPVTTRGSSRGSTRSFARGSTRASAFSAPSSTSSSAPSSAPSSASSSAPSSAPGPIGPSRRRIGNPRTATIQIAVPRYPPRPRHPASASLPTAPSAVADDLPPRSEAQLAVTRDGEADDVEYEAPARRAGRLGGSRGKNVLGRRVNRKRVRVRPSAKQSVVEVEEDVVVPQSAATVAKAETSMKVPALLAAFSNLSPYEESEGSSAAHPNGIADDIAIALPAYLPDELIGGRGGRSYLPNPGSQSLSHPTGASSPNAYLPEPEARPPPGQKSYLPSFSLPNRSGNPSYLPEPGSVDRPRASLFDGLALPPVDAPRPKPEPTAEPAECSADPGAIRLELRFLRPCNTDSDCGVNLACFSAAAPCPGSAAQDSVCLPAMEAGAACLRGAHCASGECQNSVCL